MRSIYGENDTIAREVTLVDEFGNRMRADAVVRTESGEYIIYEFKSSGTARYTNNQTLVFNSISSGGDVRIVGNNGISAFGENAVIPGNTSIITRRPTGSILWEG